MAGKKLGTAMENVIRRNKAWLDKIFYFKVAKHFFQLFLKAALRNFFAEQAKRIDYVLPERDVKYTFPLF